MLNSSWYETHRQTTIEFISIVSIRASLHFCCFTVPVKYLLVEDHIETWTYIAMSRNS